MARSRSGGGLTVDDESDIEFGCGTQEAVALYPADLGDDEDSDSLVWP